MEFSKYLGGVAAAEECSSSESGWTMYIVSPMHETNYNYYHGHGDHHQHEHVDDKSHGGDDHKMYQDHEDSDDSMVSDASSRPSRQAILCGMSKKRGGLRREAKHVVNQKQAEKKKLYDRRQRAVKEDGYKTRTDVKARKTN